jgi:hypothetical protein
LELLRQDWRRAPSRPSFNAKKLREVNAGGSESRPYREYALWSFA